MRNGIKYGIGMLIGILLMVGCQKDHDILDRKQFRNLLIDIHRADAVLSTMRQQGAFDDMKNYEYYNTIFAKYDITRAEFDSCMIYYSAQTKQFSKMYDFIIDSLNREMSAAERVMQKLKANDSLEFFPIPDTLFFDDCYKYVDVEIDSLKEGLYKFSTTFKFDTLDKGKNNQIESFFLSSNRKDTLRVREVKIVNDTLKRNYNWQQYIDSTYTILQIRYVMSDNIEKLKKRAARSWDTHLFKPYISNRTRERFITELEYKKKEQLIKQKPKKR